MITAITPKIPWNVNAHLIMTIIEDFAGTRSLRADQRKQRLDTRKKRKRQAGSIDFHEANGDLQEGYGAFPPPSLHYTCELLDVTSNGDAGKAGKMIFTKLRLLSIMNSQTPLGDAAWKEAVAKLEDGFKQRVEESLRIPRLMEAEDVKSVEGMRRAVLALVAAL